MSGNEMREFQHYTPQHPLPAPIREMTRDETICQYCGVSYLIHNEIKVLEDKLALAEKELQLLRGYPQREEELRRQLEATQQMLAVVKTENGQKDECISGLHTVIQSSEEKLKVIQLGQDELSRTADKLRKHNETLCEQLKKTSLSLKNQRSEISTLREEVIKHKSQNSDLIKSTTAQIQQACQAYAKSHEDLESRIGVLEMEKKVLTESSKSLKTQVSEQKEKLETLTASQSQADAEKEMIKKLEDEVSSLTAQNRQLTMEAQQFQDQLRSKSKESEEVMAQGKRKEQHLESSLGQLSQELQERIADLAACKKKLKDMETKFVEQHLQEEENRSRTAASMNETKELKEALTRMRKDMEALKAERELMITSHQNRIEQLRESFKNKLAETEHWPEKLEEALRLERDKHQAEMTVFSHKLKEDFIAELRVEKEKYDQLMEKYQAELREKNREIEGRLSDQHNQREREMNNLRIKYESDVRVLHNELSQKTETENDLRKEVHSLKSIISDLENRLGKLSEGSVEETHTLRETLQKLKMELNEVRDTNRTSEERIAELKEEILFLQETVRKECEERYELTEALSEARKELLSLKKPAGGYPPSAGSQRSSELMKSGSNISLTSISQPSSARFNKTPPGDVTQQNNINYHGENAKPAGKIRGGTIAENRRRIAAILGKR